jgi:hypothetical protein
MEDGDINDSGNLKKDQRQIARRNGFKAGGLSHGEMKK